MEYSISKWNENHLVKVVREEVFMKEQGFENEFDKIDIIAFHALITDHHQPVACGRLFSEDGIHYTIGRVAVIKSYRQHHLGKEILGMLEKKAVELKAKQIELSSQVQAKGFYEKQGYIGEGEEYLDEHCPHIKMVKQLS